MSWRASTAWSASHPAKAMKGDRGSIKGSLFLVHYPVTAMAGVFFPGRSRRATKGRHRGNRQGERGWGRPADYNLGTQERIVRGRMPRWSAHQRAFRPLPAHRAVQLHAPQRRNLGGPIKVQKFSEFIRNLVVPTNLNLVIAKPCGYQACSSRPEPRLSRRRQPVSAATGASIPASRAVISRKPSSASFRAVTSFHEYGRSWKPVT